MPRAAAVLAERAGLTCARLGVVPPPLPLPLYDAYLAPMASRALVAACATGLADALPGRAEELAQRLDLDPLGVDVVLRSLTTLGYVRARRGRYRLTRAGRWLERDRLGRVVGEFVPDDWTVMARLEDVLRGGAPAGLHDLPPGDPFWGRYQRAMLQMSAFAAGPFAAAVPVKRPRRLLDLGGGHGAYAQALARRHPSLEAIVVDLPAAAAHGAPGLQYLAGDLFEVELPAADLVTANNVLHTLDRDASLRLLRRARDALEPGGTFAALDLDMPEPGEHAVQPGVLTSLVMYTSFGTRSWTGAELVTMAREAGFTAPRILRPLRLPGNLVLVAKR